MENTTMADGNKVTVFVPVVCNCGHPIAGADVKVTIVNDRTGPSKPERTIYGTTNAAGIFYERYDRGSGKPLDIALKGGGIQVIACDGTVKYGELEAVGDIDLGGVFGLMESVYDTVIASGAKLDDPEGLLKQAQSLAKATSEATFGWFLSPIEVVPVECHKGECADAKDEHATGTVLIDGGATRVTFSNAIERDWVPWFGDTRDFTFDVASTDEATLTDFRLCFPSPSSAAGQKALAAKLDAVLARAVTKPFGWTQRREGSCLVFETNDAVLRGIAPGETETFKIKTDESTGIGRVVAGASILEDGEHVDLDDEGGTEIPGPLMFGIDTEEELVRDDRSLLFEPERTPLEPTLGDRSSIFRGVERLPDDLLLEPLRAEPLIAPVERAIRQPGQIVRTIDPSLTKTDLDLEVVTPRPFTDDE